MKSNQMKIYGIATFAILMLGTFLVPTTSAAANEGWVTIVYYIHDYDLPAFLTWLNLVGGRLISVQGPRDGMYRVTFQVPSGLPYNPPPADGTQ
jgi:hypothetical protein